MEDIILTQDAATVQRIINAAQRMAADDKAALGFGYGICDSAGYLSAKIVDIPNMDLCPGCLFSVFFSEGFAASSPTLNVNGTGARDLKLFGSAIAPGKVRRGSLLLISFDGTDYNVVKILCKQGCASTDAVDLGLPSGLLWCEHNVGASAPEESGLYFAWGDPAGHAYGSGYDFSLANWQAGPGAGVHGNISIGNQNDMARHNMGGQWRLPNKVDCEELVANCDHEWTNQNGIDGVRFTSRVNGNSIFIPAAGYYMGTSFTPGSEFNAYWTNVMNDAWGLNDALALTFESSQVYAHPEAMSKFWGLPVRAVM